MGRRDEPKLDELQRLLRRLEYMEVDKAPKAVPKPGSKTEAPSQDAGYVGALRGGAAKEPKTSRGYAEPASEVSFTSDHDASGHDDRARSSSTAPIVIGATTAAVVSSMVVVGLLLYTQGNDREKQAEPKRLNLVAPVRSGTQASSQSPTTMAPPAAGQSDTRSLLQRADEHIRNGQLAQGRVLLEEAAKLGSGVAALTLGAMYDPTRVAEFGNLGVQADPTLARAWYERAQALGEVEASNRLSELARK